MRKVYIPVCVKVPDAVSRAVKSLALPLLTTVGKNKKIFIHFVGIFVDKTVF